MTNKQRTKEIARLRAEHAAIRKHLQSKAREIDKAITECPHDETSRMADPSGGHDHAYTCKICGKEW